MNLSFSHHIQHLFGRLLFGLPNFSGKNPCVFDETAREMDCFMPALSQPFNGISSFSPLTVQSLSVLMRTLNVCNLTFHNYTALFCSLETYLPWNIMFLTSLSITSCCGVLSTPNLTLHQKQYHNHSYCKLNYNFCSQLSP